MLQKLFARPFALVLTAARTLNDVPATSKIENC